jgi:hypothetical protein
MQFSETGITMNVTISVVGTDSYSLITKLVKQLRTVEYFATVDSSGVSETQEDGLAYVNFTVTCTYK